MPELDVTDPAQMVGLGLTPGNACSFFPHHTPEYVALVEANQPTLDHPCVCLAERAAGSSSSLESSREAGDSAMTSLLDLGSAGVVPYWESLTNSA